MLELDECQPPDPHIETAEAKIRESLQQAVSSSSRALWGVGREWALASTGADSIDGRVSLSLLGTLAGWMSDRTSDFCFDDTTNDVQRRSPGQLRTDRFEVVCSSIFSAGEPVSPSPVATRHSQCDDFDLPAARPPATSKGFSITEIKHAIGLLLDAPFEQNRHLPPGTLSKRSCIAAAENRHRSDDRRASSTGSKMPWVC